jgi:outer membrane protein insertion porin family
LIFTRYVGRGGVAAFTLLIWIFSLSATACAQFEGPIPPFQAQQFRLGRLSFSGNVHTKAALLFWLIPLNSGDVFDQSKWDLGIEQINRLGVFEPVTRSDVVFTFDYAQSLVDVEVKLTERNRQRIDVSGGGGTTGGFSIGLDYSNINLSGLADHFAARVREGNRERSFGAGYSIMLLRKTPISVDMSGFYHRLEFVDARTSQQSRGPLLIERTGGASVGLSFPVAGGPYRIGSPYRLNFLYSFTTTNLTDTFLSQPGGVEQALEQKSIRIASITPALVHDTLDRSFDPNTGQRLVLALEVGARFLGGSMNTIKPSLDYRRFLTLGSRENREPGAREQRVAGLRVRASHISSAGRPFRPEALSSVGGVPIFKRFFLGGQQDVRGYDVNSIAPLARVERSAIQNGGEPVLLSSELRPIGGDTQVVMNAEYRIPLVWRLSAAAFADFGASFNLRHLSPERVESTGRIQPLDTPVIIATVLQPIRSGLPDYRVSVGG